MDTSVLPEAEQFAHWAAHSRGARLRPINPGPFLARGELWNLGALQVTLVDVDPFEAIRDRTLVNAVAADYIQVVLLLEGAMTFESEGITLQLVAPTCFVRDYSRPSTAHSTKMRCIILYFARDFIEEAIGPIAFQGELPAIPELDLLRDVAAEMIRFFPHAAASSASLYANILRDLTAGTLLRAGVNQRTGQLSLLARAKDYVSAQPPGTLSVAGITAALGISRSVLYRLFERDGGLLAYDRMRRLRALHRAVCNPLNSSTLAELAARYGFRDKAAFSRSFRAAFGSTPTELRERHGHIASPTTNSAPLNIQRSLESLD